jgi:hypothetical protein
MKNVDALPPGELIALCEPALLPSPKFKFER